MSGNISHNKYKVNRKKEKTPIKRMIFSLINLVGPTKVNKD